MIGSNQKHVKHLIETALLHHKEGSFSKAEDIYQQLLRIAPEDVNVLNLYGVLLYQMRRYKRAAGLLDRAIKCNPHRAQSLFNRGLIFVAQDRLKDAEASYRKALRIRPDYFEAHNNLANLLLKLNRPSEAEPHYREALKVRPESAVTHSNLGMAQREMGRTDDALSSAARALEIDPNYATGHSNLGIILASIGRLREAEASFSMAISLQPDHSEAYNNFGKLLRIQKRLQEAEMCYRKALAYRPEFAEALNNLAMVLYEKGQLTESISILKSAFAKQPNEAEISNNMGVVLRNLGRWEEAEASFRWALKLKPDYSQAHSNLLFALSARCVMAQERLCREYISWGKIHGEAGRKAMFVHARPGSRPRRLRIGYVSPDFRQHPVAQFLEPLFLAHSRDRVELFCYAEVLAPDERTQRLQALANAWRSTVGMSDEKLARRIHEDRIDILVDLAGHTANNRLRAFAWKPAPIQATWLGYFSGTGLSAMDYWITDQVLHPADSTEQCVEKIVRLPRCWVCYSPARCVPAENRQKSRQNVVFGCFSHSSKLTGKTIACWAAILNKVPHSSLLLKSKTYVDQSVTDWIFQQFAQHGIPSRSVEFRRESSLEDYLETYGDVDIILDSFPRTGGTTTADALWMGVPVVTLAGRRYVERISAATLKGAGCSEWVASDTDEYVRIAVSLARNGVRKSDDRVELRKLLSGSELMDKEDFARAMEEVFEELWHQHTPSAKG